jgi:hypothetical protein
MGKQNLFLISDIDGFTPQIARLVSMLNYVRYTTISAVEGLRMNELDYLHDSQSNSIGSLLLHIASTEVSYQVTTFYKRDLNDNEKNEWEAAFYLGDKARDEIKGQELNYYLNKLEFVRSITLKELASRDDKWLEELVTLGEARRINNYFKWFHVLAHELNHRGQIRWLLNHSKNNAQ